MYKEIFNVCEKYDDYIVELRRDFHKYAETAWLEFRTTSKIAEILEENGIKFFLGKQIINIKEVMGYPSMDIIEKNIERAINQGAKNNYISQMEGYTGLMALIDSGKKGPTIALRFDIDSNDIMESNDENHRPFRERFSSVNDGFGHACGHDGHASIGVVTALVLNEIKYDLKGKVKIFFQPAEEGVRGAKAMSSTSNFEGIDYFLSSHIGFGSKERGVVIANTKGFLATTKIDAYFKGNASHAGASPENGNNALLAAASAALNIHAQCQDGRGACRVNVGQLSAGSGRNVVPDSAVMKIETRGETTEINEFMHRKTMEVLRGCANMYGVELSTEIVGSAAGGEGDKELADIVKGALKGLGIVKEVKETYNMNGSEDVTYMMERVQKQGGKAIFMILGTPISAPHHNSRFDFKEDVLLKASKIFSSIVYKILKGDHL